MKLEKIITGEHYDISRISDNTLSVVGARKVEILRYESDKINHRRIRIELANLSHFLKIEDTPEPVYFAVDTSGNGLFLTEEKVINKYRIGFELFNNNYVLFNNKLLYCNRNSFFEYDIEKDKTVNYHIPQYNSIVNVKDTLIGTRYENEDATSTCVLGIIDPKTYSISPSVTLTDFRKEKVDIKERYLLIESLGGEKYKTISFFESQSLKPCFTKRFRIPEDAGYLSDFAYNSDTNLLALVWVGRFEVINIETDERLFECEIKYGSDVDWLTDNILIVSTWEGVYKLVMK